MAVMVLISNKDALFHRLEEGGKVVQCVALLPHSSKDPGSPVSSNLPKTFQKEE